MRHEPRRTAQTAHWWVDRAANLSPAPVREVRREQWHADVTGAAEVGIARRSLVLGMLTTAATHRLTRSVPGGSMSPTTPTGSRAARLLLVGAVSSVVLSLVLQHVFLLVTSTLVEVRAAETVQAVFGLVLPLALVLVALARVTTSAGRWALSAALAVIGVGVVLLGAFAGRLAWTPVAGLGFAALVGAWLVAHQARPRAWVLVAVPMVALVAFDLVGAAARALFDAGATTRPALWQAEALLSLAVPLVMAVVAAMLLPRFDRRAVGRSVPERGAA